MNKLQEWVVCSLCGWKVRHDPEWKPDMCHGCRQSYGLQVVTRNEHGLIPGVPALEQTNNFITLYLHGCGISKVPTAFNKWVCISLLAACLEDRVFYEKLRGEKLTPHLYIFLIGPSVVGKGTALGGVRRLLCAWSALDRDSGGPINLHSGSMTYKGIIDVLSSPFADPTGQIIASPRLWLMMDELSNDIGDGQLAKSFIKMMTELYTGNYKFGDTTRGHGNKTVKDACVNWLAGSAPEWLLDSISFTEIHSGATSRIVFIFEERNRGRIFEPIYPYDWDPVMSHLIARLKEIPQISGQFTISPDALAFAKQWYHNRREPLDTAMLPSWDRGQDLAYKLAMIYSIADRPLGDRSLLEIKYKHIYNATLLVNDSLRNMQKLLSIAGGSVEQTTELSRIRERIKQAGTIGHSPLLRALPKSITGPKLTMYCMEMKAREEIEIEYSERGGKVYGWKGE